MSGSGGARAYARLADSLGHEPEDEAGRCFAAAKTAVRVDAELLFVDPCRHVSALRAKGESPWTISEES